VPAHRHPARRRPEDLPKLSARRPARGGGAGVVRLTDHIVAVIVNRHIRGPGLDERGYASHKSARLPDLYRPEASGAWWLSWWHAGAH
jgi:hypothetical protein